MSANINWTLSAYYSRVLFILKILVCFYLICPATAEPQRTSYNSQAQDDFLFRNGNRGYYDQQRQQYPQSPYYGKNNNWQDEQIKNYNYKQAQEDRERAENNRLKLEEELKQQQRIENEKLELELQRRRIDELATRKSKEIKSENIKPSPPVRQRRTFWENHEVLIVLGTLLGAIFVIIIFACYLRRNDKKNYVSTKPTFTFYHFEPPRSLTSNYNYDGEESFRSRTPNSAYIFPDYNRQHPSLHPQVESSRQQSVGTIV